MTSSDAFDPDELIVDGLTNFANLARDRSYLQLGPAVYRSVAEVFRQNLKPGETCSLAFPSMIVRPDLRTECFVAVTSSHLVVAWTRGMIRKKTEWEIVPLMSITDAKWEVSAAPGTRGTILMNVQADRTLTLALPTERAEEVGSAIRSALLAS
jgi:hypothetical protein